MDTQPDRPDHVYLSGVGISKSTTSAAARSQPGQFLGTPEYTSPEQAGGRAVHGRADQYALACAAWHLLTGTVPFQRDQGLAVLLAHLTSPRPPLAAFRPGLPAAAGQALARAMAREPGERYPTCGEFTDTLREALGLPPYRPTALATPAHPRTKTSASPAHHATARITVTTTPAEPAGARATAEASSPAAAGTPGNPAGTAIARRGENYRAMGRYDDALAYANRAIELTPSGDGHAAKRAEIYRLMGLEPPSSES